MNSWIVFFFMFSKNVTDKRRFKGSEMFFSFNAEMKSVQLSVQPVRGTRARPSDGLDRRRTRTGVILYREILTVERKRRSLQLGK